MSRLTKSIRHAVDGLKLLTHEEPNFQIHLVWIAIVTAHGVIFQITLTEWCLLAVVIAGVFITETINTSIENVMDFISTKHNNQIKRIKDLAAAAVLLAVFAAIAVGLIIFLPKYAHLLGIFWYNGLVVNFHHTWSIGNKLRQLS